MAIFALQALKNLNASHNGVLAREGLSLISIQVVIMYTLLQKVIWRCSTSLLLRRYHTSVQFVEKYTLFQFDENYMFVSDLWQNVRLKCNGPNRCERELVLSISGSQRKRALIVKWS